MLPSDGHYQAVATTIARKYNLPGLFYLDLWPVTWGQIVVTDPDLALDLTVVRNHPKHEGIGNMINPIIGESNIVSIDGPRWKYLHKMVSPAFSISHITAMRPMVAAEVMKFRAVLNQKAQSGETFQLEECAQNLTFDVISTAAFGKSLDAQKQGSPALHHFKSMVQAHMKSRESFNYIGNFFANRTLNSERRKLDKFISELIEERFDHIKRK